VLKVNRETPYKEKQRNRYVSSIYILYKILKRQHRKKRQIKIYQAPTPGRFRVRMKTPSNSASTPAEPLKKQLALLWHCKAHRSESYNLPQYRQSLLTHPVYSIPLGRNAGLRSQLQNMGLAGGTACFLDFWSPKSKHASMPSICSTQMLHYRRRSLKLGAAQENWMHSFTRPIKGVNYWEMWSSSLLKAPLISYISLVVLNKIAQIFPQSTKKDPTYAMHNTTSRLIKRLLILNINF